MVARPSQLLLAFHAPSHDGPRLGALLAHWVAAAADCWCWSPVSTAKLQKDSARVKRRLTGQPDAYEVCMDDDSSAAQRG